MSNIRVSALFPRALIRNTTALSGREGGSIKYDIQVGGTPFSVIYKKVGSVEPIVYDMLEREGIKQGIPNVFHNYDNELVISYDGEPLPTSLIPTLSLLKQLHQIHHIFKGHPEVSTKLPAFDRRIVYRYFLRGLQCTRYLSGEQSERFLTTLTIFKRIIPEVMDPSRYTLIHNDLFRENVVCSLKRQSMTIIDWGKAAYGNPLLDIAWLWPWGDLTEAYYELSSTTFPISRAMYQRQYYICKLYMYIREISSLILDAHNTLDKKETMRLKKLYRIYLDQAFNIAIRC